MNNFIIKFELVEDNMFKTTELLNGCENVGEIIIQPQLIIRDLKKTSYKITSDTKRESVELGEIYEQNILFHFILSLESMFDRTAKVSYEEKTNAYEVII